VSRLREYIKDDGHAGRVTVGFALVGTGAGIVEDPRGVVAVNAHGSRHSRNYVQNRPTGGWIGIPVAALDIIRLHTLFP
jgi:hypothetical protein